MPAIRYDLTDSRRIEQGVTWNWDLGIVGEDGTLLDLSSGYTARMSVSNKKGGATEYLEVTNSDSITLQEADSDGINMAIELTPTNTDDITAKKAYHVLELVETGADTDRLFEGCVEVALDTPEV